MFSNLIESDSHRKEFRRRSSFFLATVAAYALILSAAGVASIYAYDAHLEAQTTELIVNMWVPPVKQDKPIVRPDRPQPPRHAASDAPVDPGIKRPERTVAISALDAPNKIPDGVGVKASPVPPMTTDAVISLRNVNSSNTGSPNTSGTCVTCNGPATVVKVDATPPTPPPVVKPPTMARLPSSVLLSKVVSLPQPPYPPLAKQIKAQGAVNVQILVDEQGRVVSAQAVNGNPMLLAAAKEAALRARFTPTILSGVAVKVQGVITYNFVLQ